MKGYSFFNKSHSSIRKKEKNMILGFIKANFPGERRVPLLPKDIVDFDNQLLVETGFGSLLDIDDAEYEKAGCKILSREEVFKQSDAIFSLKLIQPSDYDYIKKGQLIIGWTHPYGSGKSFMKDQAYPKELIVVDLDNGYPAIYYKDEVIRTNLPSGILERNSFYAGYAGVLDDLLKFGILPDESTKIAVLGSGNVSQGAFHGISKFSSNVKMYYRRTLPVFKETFSSYDIIVNGIEISAGSEPILSLDDQKHLKKGTFIIDTAADAGNTIEANHFTSMGDSIYEKDGIYYYCVPNTPSIAYRNVSALISKQLSKYVFKDNVDVFKKAIK